MPFDPIATPDAPRAIGPYSQAIAARGGRWVFCSGQIPIDPRTGELVGAGDVQAETHRVMQNLAAIDLTDLQSFALVNEVYGSYFTGPPPARATVQVAGLPKGAQVEIDAVAITG
jgi:2-iminobutanoate/2-iminopropanoate deaminase